MSYRKSDVFEPPGKVGRRSGFYLTKTPKKNANGLEDLDDFFLSDNEYQSQSSIIPTTSPSKRLSVRYDKLRQLEQSKSHETSTPKSPEEKKGDTPMSSEKRRGINKAYGDYSRNDDNNNEEDIDEMIRSAEDTGTPIKLPIRTKTSLNGSPGILKSGDNVNDTNSALRLITNSSKLTKRIALNKNTKNKKFESQSIENEPNDALKQNVNINVTERKRNAAEVQSDGKEKGELIEILEGPRNIAETNSMEKFEDKKFEKENDELSNQSANDESESIEASAENGSAKNGFAEKEEMSKFEKDIENEKYEKCDEMDNQKLRGSSLSEVEENQALIKPKQSESQKSSKTKAKNIARLDGITDIVEVVEAKQVHSVKPSRLPLAKHSKTKPAKAFSAENTPIRRSTRTRVAPVASWKNEKVIYKTTKINGALVKEVKNVFHKSENLDTSPLVGKLHKKRKPSIAPVAEDIHKKKKRPIRSVVENIPRKRQQDTLPPVKNIEGKRKPSALPIVPKKAVNQSATRKQSISVPTRLERLTRSSIPENIVRNTRSQKQDNINSKNITKPIRHGKVIESNPKLDRQKPRSRREPESNESEPQTEPEQLGLESQDLLDDDEAQLRSLVESSSEEEPEAVEKESPEIEGEPIKGTEWQDSKSLRLSVFEGPGTEAQIDRTIAWGPNQFKNVTIIKNDEEYFKIGTLFDQDSEFCGGGIIELSPGASKAVRSNNDTYFIFYVITGTLQVSLSRNIFVVTQGCSFEIPMGNFYHFENKGKDTVKMFFVQSKYVVIADSDDEMDGNEEY